MQNMDCTKVKSDKKSVYLSSFKSERYASKVWKITKGY